MQYSVDEMYFLKSTYAEITGRYDDLFDEEEFMEWFVENKRYIAEVFKARSCCIMAADYYFKYEIDKILKGKNCE